ncbi:uncharacterized protein EDB91DRAFT_1253839 [Suillus paluster]|uniref:uncharacterized protein n=1 Tax=Suillus paluster TaxID=48578 RepID=UPI001B866D0A|nr:uncharacterized protein EDB91DRAFT_1253839 [Suillus paluster]KAG1727577.1 hypothetical protein EDB91DRAFT_1253839 [Suillus paluster]
MVQLSEVAGLQLNFKYTINYQYIRPSNNMNSHPTVRFNDPPATEYYSMDVDDSTQSQTSTDDLYLGPNDDIEDDSVSSSGPYVLAAILDQLPPAQSDQPVQYIDPDLYLGPDEDLIDCDDELGSVVLKGEVTQRASASARALCPLPEYVPFNFQGTEGKSDGSPGSSGGQKSVEFGGTPEDYMGMEARELVLRFNP